MRMNAGQKLMKTLSYDEAREQFADITDLDAQGEPVIILKNAERLILQKDSRKPVSDGEEGAATHDAYGEPLAPPGFFNSIYDEEYREEMKRINVPIITTIDP